MKCFSFLQDAIEQEIVHKLQSSPIERRKGEDQLFYKYSYLIKAGIKEYSISEDDATYAYSNTILAVINAIVNGTFRGKCSVKTYIYKIFHNKSIDAVRSKTSQKNNIYHTVQLGTAELHLSDTSRLIIEELVMRSEVEMLFQKLKQLNDSAKQALLLSAEGYTDDEIAQLLKYKSAGVVKTIRLRSFRKLYQLMRNDMHDHVYCSVDGDINGKHESLRRRA